MDKIKLLLSIFVILALSSFVTATTDYILTPINDVHIENLSLGSRGLKYVMFNLTSVLADYQNKNMTFNNSRFYLYYYDLDKNWVDRELWTRNPATTCWTESSTCLEFEACKGERSLNRISKQDLFQDDYRYYDWNASGTEGSLRPAVWWHLENNHSNITFHVPFTASEYTCQSVEDDTFLYATDNSGKVAICHSRTGTYTPYLTISLQDPTEERTKIRFRSTNRIIYFLSTMRHIALTDT